MRILQINTVYATGSTGKIAKHLHDCAEERGYRCVTAYRYSESGAVHPDAVPVSSWLDCHIHNRLAVHSGLQGCFSAWRTGKFLRWVKKYQPDVIHIHNIHGSFINHRMLFNFVKKHAIPMVWTLHDCWSFTGGCPHFIGYHCEQWKNGCGKCPHFAQSAGAVINAAPFMWKRKRNWFTGVGEMTLVCPSQWLSGLVAQSFLKDYPVKIIPNGIDLQIFHPTESDFREKYGLQHKKIVLGVSFVWGKKKGLDIFCELASRLGEEYKIVLVGTNAEIDQQLPKGILSIHRTETQQELAGIYSAADVFVNPTREEVLGMVNIEALACGTPVAAFRVGGVPEIVDSSCGSIVDCDDVDALEKEIIRICTQQPFSRETCLKTAQRFERNQRYKEYVDLYEGIVSGRNQTDGN